MSSQYVELRSIIGGDRFTSLGHTMGFACWLRYCTDVTQRMSTKLYTMFGGLLGWYTIYTFLGFCPSKRILPGALCFAHVIFWATICKTVRPMLSDHCLSVSLSRNVGVLWSNSWMDRDATWYANRPQPRPHCVRWGPSSPSQPTPLFSPCLSGPNGWMDQDATWY